MSDNYFGGRANGNRNGDGIQINGDNNRVTAARTEPEHMFTVGRRCATGVSDKVALSLSIAASLVTIIAAVFSGVQWPTSADVWMSRAPALTVSLYVAGVAFVITVLGWRLLGWLKRRVFANTAIFGYVPVGRGDSDGETRLYFEKLVGECAIDGAPMTASAVPTRWVDRFDARGKRVGRKVTERELRMICARNPDDPRHQGRIDLTDNSGS